MEAHGIEATWETRERVVVAVTGAPSGEHLIRRAARMAQRAKADLLGVHVQADRRAGRRARRAARAPSPAAGRPRRQLPRGRRRRRGQGAHPVRPRRARHPARARRHPPQPVGRAHPGLGHQRRAPRGRRHRRPRHQRRGARRPRGRRRPARRSSAGGGCPTCRARRQAAGWLLAAHRHPAAHAGCSTQLRGHAQPARPTCCSSWCWSSWSPSVGGLWPALVAAVVVVAGRSTGSSPSPSTPSPSPRARTSSPWSTFLVVAALVSALVTQVSRRSADALRARAEAEALARVAGGLVGDDDAVAEMVGHLRTTFDRRRGRRAGARRRPAGGGSRPSAGDARAVTPDGRRAVGAADRRAPCSCTSGPPLTAEDQRVLQVFAAQLGVGPRAPPAARPRPPSAEALAEADQLRTAILRAVSHDLRTPLASIKASVTSLLQDDVDWTAGRPPRVPRPPSTRRPTGSTTLVGNLLDMSRLETGALSTSALRPVGARGGRGRWRWPA